MFIHALFFFLLGGPGGGAMVPDEDGWGQGKQHSAPIRTDEDGWAQGKQH